MQFAIDIDGTIASHSRSVFTALCNHAFDLGLDASASLSYNELMRHPRLVEYREARTDAEFQEAIERIEQAPEMLRSLPTFAGAVQGVQRLAEHGGIAYYTVRRDRDEVKAATRVWLREQGFPRPDRAVFCISLMNKLIRVYQWIRAEPGPCMLIDDLAAQLAMAFSQLQAAKHPRFSPQECSQITALLQRHLTLVSFGNAAPESSCGLQVTRLSSWQNIDELLIIL